MKWISDVTPIFQKPSMEKLTTCHKKPSTMNMPLTTQATSRTSTTQ